MCTETNRSIGDRNAELLCRHADGLLDDGVVLEHRIRLVSHRIDVRPCLYLQHDLCGQGGQNEATRIRIRVREQGRPAIRRDRADARTTGHKRKTQE